MRNSSLVKWSCAENSTGLKPITETWIVVFYRLLGRRAFPVEGSKTVRTYGRQGSENAGMSSDKAGENPARRKPKVS